MKLAIVCCVIVVLCLLINNAQCQMAGDAGGIHEFLSGGNDGGGRRWTGGVGFGRGGRARRGSLMNM